MQKRLQMLFYALFVLSACAVKETTTSYPETLNIIPKPVFMNVSSSNVLMFWDNTVPVIAVTEEEKQVASMMQDLLPCKNITLNIVESSDEIDRITLSTVSVDSLGAEGYKLTINENGTLIQANTGPGLFYGVQTLMQMATPECKPLKHVAIVDYPRYKYRGLHLDVGRHRFPAEFIKKYIDLLARHKMNRFHWHLTEDQGWRIEIKKYPKLQEISAFRKETVIGKASTKTRDQAKYDGQRYGGFYTQEEIKDIVKYASERHVTIIPEIELPGHAQAALAAYPNLGCKGGPYEVATTWGVFKDVYCAGKEETFTFLQDVLDEVMALFPSEYIHIGGDECPKDNWETCPNCQKRIKTEKVTDTHGLQSYFIQRIEKHLNSKGRQIIGWDEILEGGLAPNATVMSWRGEEGGIAAAKQKHNVIMTPDKWCYFDYYQDTTAGNHPLAIGGYLPISKVYSYEPTPSQLSPEEAKYILGAQANVWSEYMKDAKHVEYMVYPRACALAEVVWSPKESRNYQDFLTRMKTHVKRLETWDVNFAGFIEKEFEPASKPQ
jgi:hexosaminidase